MEESPEIQAKKTPIIKKIETIVAILAGLATFIVGFYSIKKDLFKGKGTIVGIVRDFKSQHPIAEVKIEVTDPSGQLITTFKSDRNGEFKEELKEGNYIIKVTHPSYDPQIANINITGKETSRIDLAHLPLQAKEASRSSGTSKITKNKDVGDTLKKKAVETGFDILRRKL